MLDESIDSSPNISSSSLRQKRAHRKAKTRRIHELSLMSLPTQTTSKVACKDFNTFWDSDSEGSLQFCLRLNQSNLFNNQNDFGPFEEEKKLTAADRVALCTTQRRPQQQSQVFQTCEGLLMNQKEEELSLGHDSKHYLSFENDADNDCLEMQTEWLLEIFEAASEAEQNLDETLKPATPQAVCHTNDTLSTTFCIATPPAIVVPVQSAKKKSIVEEILADFCSDLPEIEDEIDVQPYFHFRKKRIRTYERRFRCYARTTTTLLVNETDHSDTSSELSVQEAPTQSIPIMEPLALDISGPMHNNLLDLSAFFTQNHLENACDLTTEPTHCHDDGELTAPVESSFGEASNLTNEMLTLRAKYENFSKPILCFNSNDLLGFASPAEYAARTAQSAENINHIDLDITMVESQTQVNTNRPSLENVNANVESNTSVEDIWQNDDEFFAYFKTQNLLEIAKAPPETPGQAAKNDDIASKNNVSASAAKIDNDNKRKEFENSPKTQHNQYETQDFEFDDLILSEWPLVKDDKPLVAPTNKLTTFEKPVVKTKTTVNVLQCDINETELDFDDMLLSEWPLENHDLPSYKSQQRVLDQREHFENERNVKTQRNEIRSTRTASTVRLSEATSSKQGQTLTSQLKLEDPDFGLINTELTRKPFMGFRTGNSKEIHVSEEAKKQAAKVFALLPEFPKELTLKTDSALPSAVGKCIEPKPSYFGFQTASAKPITISERARKNYQNFFDEILRDDEGKSDRPVNSENATTGVVEGSVDKNSKHQTQKKNFENETLTKRKFRSLENANASNNEQPTKMLCKARTTDDILRQHSISVVELLPTAAPTSSANEKRRALSLTNKRKLRNSLKSDINTDDAYDSITPVKLHTTVVKSSSYIAEHTPNAADFYKRLPDASSTPQTTVTLTTPFDRTDSFRVADNLDADFKRINWEHVDDSATPVTAATSLMPLTPKRDENSNLNETPKHLPSPQERIENLSGCGDPPPLPTMNLSGGLARQRTLGLRRCRRSFQQN